jgi:DNA primase
VQSLIVRQTGGVAISDDDIAKVRDATDFVAIVSEHLHLTRAGNRFKGLCPFHSEKSPSFTINPEKGLYFCFGCQAKGDVIRFVMELDHLDFAGAVEKLASKAGVTIRYDNEASGRDRLRRERLRETMQRSVEWYHNQLLTAPGAGQARGYLKSRGYDGETVRAFKLGWAPDGWDTLVKALNMPTDIAKDTGLGFVNRSGRMNDFFQSRILFPIFDVSGQPIAFGGRKMPEAEGPKYKNSSETTLYSKSRTLYGLNWAKTGIVAAGEVIVCEGYTDVIAFHRAGMARAVATCGTALADEHFKMLKNFARRIVLAYDADSAGQNAAEKFYAWEKKFEIDLVVVKLPKGTDPADLAKNDPEALKKAVADAQPFLAFRIDRSMEAADLTTPEGRGRAFELAADMVGEHPSPYVREEYLRLVADRCRVSEAAMTAMLAELSSPKRQKKLQERKVQEQKLLDQKKAAKTGRESGGDQATDTARVGGRGTDGPKRDDSGNSGGPAKEIPNEEIVPPDDPSMGAVIARPKRIPPSIGRASSSATKASAMTTRIGKAEQQLLTALIHDPETVVAYCVESIFSTALHARACALLLEVGDVGPAIDRCVDDAELELLLQRLAVEQPTDDGLDVVALVMRGAVARVVDTLRRDPESPQYSDIGFLREHEMALAERTSRPGALDHLVGWFVSWGTPISQKP